MIGLRRFTVLVVEHQPDWADLYAKERDVIRRQAGELVCDVQHVGSTAVPGLPAKPILDIAVAVESHTAVSDVVGALVGIGYLDRGPRDGGYLLVKESAPDIRTVHLHISLVTDDDWRECLCFRDLLSRDENLRQRYAQLKRKLAGQFPNDREAYSAGKSEFIKTVIANSARPL